ncbi:MAG: TMEM198/TM7SF3 family protein [Anaerolineaceae bacterium]|nr:TMEM198/TM7SF3 family protein [Anaerolineaceae bacterium]
MIYFTAALVLVGLVICVSGRTLFYTMPFLGGFLVAGMLGYQIGLMFITPPANLPDFVMPLASFIVIGLVGGFLAKALYTILLVISGFALGSFIGLMAGYLINLGGNPYALTTDFFTFQPENTVQLYTMVIAAVLFAALSVTSQDMMTMLSTAFFGAGIAVFNMSDLFYAETNLIVATNTVLVTFAWLFLGMAGMYIQNKNDDID